MPYVLVRHTVEDYDKWKPLFDGHADARSAAGSLGGQLMRSAENPNDITVMFEWDTMENAMQFVQSPELREVMHDAGIVGKPEVSFLESIGPITV